MTDKKRILILIPKDVREEVPGCRSFHLQLMFPKVVSHETLSEVVGKVYLFSEFGCGPGDISFLRL